MMMEHTIDKYESDVQMAIRLMNTLNSREDVRSQKKRYMLEKWPENIMKHKKLQFLAARYMAELDLRDDKSIASLRPFVEESVTLPCKRCKKGSTSSPDISFSKILDLPDSDLLKMCPVLFSCLNLRSLKGILAALSGSRVATSQCRSSIQHKIKMELAKSVIASPMYTKQLLIAATLLRSPKSYYRPFQFARLKIKPFSKLPPSIVAAASETFKHIDKFPPCVIFEVYKLLSTSSHMVTQLPTQQPCESVMLQHVHRNFEGLLESLKEGKPLPPWAVKALHLISLSAKLSYGDDGNLKELLSPLSPKQCTLEEIYESAFLRLEHMNMEDLSRISCMIGLDQQLKTKSRYIYEIQIRLFASTHCIYDGIDIPDNILKALSMINDVLKTEEKGKKRLKTEEKRKKTDTVSEEHVESRRMERVSVELNAILDLSAEFRNLVWEFHEAFLERNLECELPSTSGNHTNSEKSNLNSHNLQEMDIEENIEVQNEIERDIEEFSDEVAKATYLLLRCLFQRVSKRSSDTISQDRIILEKAKCLNIISESVLQEVEIRLNGIVAGDST